MFRNNTILGLVAVFAVISALPMAAQRPAGVGGPPSGTTGATSRPANVDPAMRYEFMAGFLGLSESQKAQVKSIFDQSSSASDALQGQMESARLDLGNAVKASRTDAEIDRLAAAIGTLEGQGLAIQAKSRAKLYALLTPDQKQKLAQLEAMGQGRGFGGRP